MTLAPFLLFFLDLVTVVGTVEVVSGSVVVFGGSVVVTVVKVDSVSFGFSTVMSRTVADDDDTSPLGVVDDFDFLLDLRSSLVRRFFFDIFFLNFLDFYEYEFIFKKKIMPQKLYREIFIN